MTDDQLARRRQFSFQFACWMNLGVLALQVVLGVKDLLLNQGGRTIVQGMFIIFAGMMYWGVVLTEQRFRALIAKYQAEQQLAEQAVAAMKRAIESVAGPMIEVGQEIH